MKIYVALALVQLLSVSLAFETPQQVAEAIDDHVKSKIFSLLSVPGIARAGGGIKCYDKYLPLITAATENSKTDTEACIQRAASRREDELNKVKQERENLNLQVQNVENTLTACLNKSDDLEYLKCLKENSANLQTTINEVGKTSTTLADNLSTSYKNIDTTEDSCIKNVIAKSKSESDELLAALQNCLMNGLDDGGSDGGQGGDGGSDGDQGGDGGSDGGSDGNEGGSEGGDAGSDGNEGGSEGGDASSDGNEGGSEGGEAGSNGNDGSDINPDDNSNNGNTNDAESDNNAANNDNGVVPDARKEPEEDVFP